MHVYLYTFVHCGNRGNAVDMYFFSLDHCTCVIHHEKQIHALKNLKNCFQVLFLYCLKNVENYTFIFPRQNSFY